MKGTKESLDKNKLVLKTCQKHHQQEGWWWEILRTCMGLLLLTVFMNEFWKRKRRAAGDSS